MKFKSAIAPDLGYMHFMNLLSSGFFILDLLLYTLEYPNFRNA